MPSFRQRWLDVVAAIYIYNEHRGYTALDKVLYAVRRHFTDDHRLIAEIEQHRADERKHYLMFKRWFEKRGQMPLDVDSTCGHIDRFVELVFRKRIDDLDLDAFIEQGHFAELCRVISLTEKRGYRQVEALLRHPAVRQDRMLSKIYQIIREDEPRHWAPYDRWLKVYGGREPVWWERAIDSFIHSELLILKLPALFVNPGLKRRTHWPGDDDPTDGSDTPESAAMTKPLELAEAGLP
jgi:rubrerythrin